MFFPTLFDNVLEKEGRSYMKKRLLALCDMIIETDKGKAAKELYEIELDLLRLAKPKNFSGIQSYEIQFEKNYQSVVVGLSKHTNKDVGTMKVIEVYTLMETLKSKEKNVR